MHVGSLKKKIIKTSHTWLFCTGEPDANLIYMFLYTLSIYSLNIVQNKLFNNRRASHPTPCCSLPPIVGAASRNLRQGVLLQVTGAPERRFAQPTIFLTKSKETVSMWYPLKTETGVRPGCMGTAPEEACEENWESAKSSNKAGAKPTWHGIPG